MAQLHAEPQAQKQSSTEQPPGQGSTATPGRLSCGHGGDPGLRLRSGSYSQLPAACREAFPMGPDCQLGQLPSGPPSSLRQRRPRRNLILPSRSRKSEGRWARRAPRLPWQGWVSLGMTSLQSLAQGDSHRARKGTFLPGTWALTSFAGVIILHKGRGKVS